MKRGDPDVEPFRHPFSDKSIHDRWQVLNMLTGGRARDINRIEGNSILRDKYRRSTLNARF